jgi:C4-dicarboxylate-specific signal transduction histidine kinase
LQSRWPQIQGVTKLRDRFALEVERQPDVFSLERVGWLIRLRWFALLGIALAAGLAAIGAFPGVRYSVLLAVASFAGVYNFLLWRSHRAGASPEGGVAGVIQALGDMLLLTIVLWAAGGVSCPFITYYIFHVAIVGILAGPRATKLAAVTAMLGVGFLVLSNEVPALQIGTWNPVGEWGTASEATAFITTVSTVAYLVTHAVRELRERERALIRARDNAALEYELLTNTLDQLEAGLEVLSADGSVEFRNRRAEELRSGKGEMHEVCSRSGHPCRIHRKDGCSIEQALDRREPGRCRFAVLVDGQERVFEMLTFPLATTRSGAQLMNLYVDRTATVLADQRLLLAERLVSLGRVAQGVAHELNTPLATIRTLASDMRASLRELQHGDALTDPRLQKVVADLDESSALVHDETLRLGRITQSLLAGGDLVRPHIRGAVPVAAVIERARALVFAGVRAGPGVLVGAGLDALSVHVDQDRLVQVCVNLLQNAYDAVRDKPDGQVSVEALAEDDAVVIRIEDNGPGIPDEVRARLFEPFATTKAHGTGLGLYTSYMLVRSMHGDLFLDARPGSGTVASVRLPRGKTRAAKPEALS